MPRTFRRLIFAFLLCAATVRAENNYEIQVDGSETVAKETTMVELHSNYTPNGLALDNHALHVPPEWHWPVGVSLSAEFGYVRPKFSEDSWTWELRPIIDKGLGRWYVKQSHRWAENALATLRSCCGSL